MDQNSGFILDGVYYRIIFLIILFSFGNCERLLIDDNANSTPTQNFDELWKVINEKYSFFEFKKIDWNAIRERYRPLINDNMSLIEEFEVYDDMLFELRDGHVNLFSPFNLSRNWEWYLNSPENFNFSVVERYYLRDDHVITGGLRHTLLDGNYAYIYYGSFNRSIANLDAVASLYSDAKGFIIDVRNNGGGSLNNAIQFANRFADRNRLVLKQFYKSGPGPNDFAEAVDTFSEPFGSYSITKPVVILTNRRCFSATSFFVTMMKEFPNVTVLGDRTGGGSGTPSDYLLANGWRVRFSSSRATNASGEDFELGVFPDVRRYLDVQALLNGEDSYIKEAKTIISIQYELRITNFKFTITNR